MSKMNRRRTLKILASAPMAAAFTWTEAEVQDAAHRVREERQNPQADRRHRFFSEHEYESVKLLVDYIIPADERSGSATDVGVPEFIDFMMIDQPQRQVAMRGGLAWIDLQCQKRFGNPFIGCGETERKQILDEIAYPQTAKPEVSHGVAFFNSLRDLTATGFWTSKEGVADLKYVGNVFVPEWNGCPEEALRHLGVKYED